MQNITIDGVATDWHDPAITSDPTYSYALDAFGSGVPDSQFEGGKDILTVPEWGWTEGQTKGKNDIANGAAILIGSRLYFAGDRLENEGAARIGFWFFLNGTAPEPLDGKKGGFSPPHGMGDLLVLSNFEGGGKYSKTRQILAI